MHATNDSHVIEVVAININSDSSIRSSTTTITNSSSGYSRW